MATEPARTLQTRDHAERALVRLALHLGTHQNDIVVIGGLAPPFLTPQADPPHQGTTDVDLLISLGFVYERDEQDFGWLETAFDHAGFVEDNRTGGGWRWKSTLDDVIVKLELLCDVWGDLSNQPLALPGCPHASAMNLQGPGAALADPEPQLLHVPPDLGSGTVNVPHAGLGGYLIAKAAAAAHRQLRKDFYDFAFVLLHNDQGGPSDAGQTILAGPAHRELDRLRPELTATISAFTQHERPAAIIYAEEMLSSGAQTDRDILIEDAAGAAGEFAALLGLT